MISENLKRMTRTESEIQPDGWEKRTSYVKHGDGNWITHSETVNDFLGRSVSTITPLGTTSNFYDRVTGRLTKVACTGSADVIYSYNELGEITETCVDVNANGAVDYSGPDQITVSSNSYEQIAGNWWQVSYSSIYFQANLASTITSSVNRVRMTGLGVDTHNGGILTAQSESEDWLGNVTRSSTYTDAGNVTTWQVTDTPNSNIDAVQKSVAGYPVLSVSSTSITNSYTYDGLARIVETTEGTEVHRVKSVTVYNDLGQVAYVENAASNRSSFVYNGLGQRVATSNALGQVSHTAYNLQGNTIATWGTSYPVAYEFDTAGRMIALATTRSNDYANVNLNSLVPSGETLSSLSLQSSSLDITRWFYDDVTGLLTNKLYADGNGTAYTYTETGRLATRRWARGITATYSYNNLGQLTNISYSDTTPAVTFTYDRLGRMTSAASPASTRTFEYTGLALTKETQDNYIIERIYDTFGRTIGYELYRPDDLVNPVQTIIYEYSDSGRFNSVTFVILSFIFLFFMHVFLTTNSANGHE